MNGRRRFARYVLDVPPDGCARLVSDCTIEEWHRDSAVVVTNLPAKSDEEFVLQLRASTGATMLYPVRVLTCTPDSRHGPLRFRLHVQLMSHTSATAQDGPDVPLSTPRGSD